MEIKKPLAVAGQRLRRFLNQEYRDGYLQAHVRSGIGYQIRALRTKLGLSQLEFAIKTGKKQSTISRLENTEYGRVSVQTLLDIACASKVALLVRFVDYPQFLKVSGNMSPKALAPDDIDDSIAKVDLQERSDLLSRLFATSDQLPPKRPQPLTEGILSQQIWQNADRQRPQNILGDHRWN